MKAKFTLIASALLLVSTIAGAQEQQAPSVGAQEQEPPSAKMTGEDMDGPYGLPQEGPWHDAPGYDASRHAHAPHDDPDGY
jgi:hypothetical protein